MPLDRNSVDNLTQQEYKLHEKAGRELSPAEKDGIRKRNESLAKEVAHRQERLRAGKSVPPTRARVDPG